MGTTIEIYDIYQLGNHILDELSKFVESVEEVTEQVDAFCGLLSEQDGAAVVSMKNYMSRYAGAVDMVAQSLYCAYGQILPIYEAAMSSLDADEFAVINMECVEEVIHAYITASVWLDGEVEIVNDICRKTAGFCDVDKPEETGLYDNLDELVERERRFRSEAIEIDNASCEGEIQMLADLCDYCGDYLWSMYEHRYVPCGDNTTHIDLLQNMNLLTSLMQIQMYSEANADRMDAVMEVCQHYTEVYIRSDRNEAGWNKAGAGLKLIETGLIALLSREIAVSKFMTKTDEILGTVTMLFGITEGAEGVQDITFSALGKLDTQSLNVLKSLLGEKNYYRMMKVCEVGATAASLLTDLEAVHKENLIRSGEMETEATGIKTMDDSTGIKPAELPEPPKNTEFYKENGGLNASDYISIHSQKHMYNPETVSTFKKTQFGKDVNVGKLCEDTIMNPDEVIYNIDQNVIIYKKEYSFNISTKDTPTGSHRVFIPLNTNGNKMIRMSQFPLAGGK